LGFSPFIFVSGHFKEIGITVLLLGIKPRHVEKFREYKLTDVAEIKVELGNKIIIKKHAQMIKIAVDRT